jgi:type VI secretion system secreted protein VgrG
VVKAGYDFGDNDSDPDASTWQHGTSVAGLIASRDPANLGVAPGADVVALRVFGNDNQGDFNKIADALQYVVDNHQRLGISVVNLSISDGRNYLPPFLPNSPVVNRITGLVQQLQSLKIPVVTAAGNSYTGRQGMGFTAIIKGTISVTGTDAADNLVSDAQRLGATAGREYATDLVAPSVRLNAPGEGNSFSLVDGTSFCAPLVSGAILILQQIYQNRYGTLPSVAELESWLEAGSDPILDVASNSTYARLDIPKAAALIPQPAPPPPPPVEPPPAPPAQTLNPPATPTSSPAPADPAPTSPPSSPPQAPVESPVSPPAASPPSQPLTNGDTPTFQAPVERRLAWRRVLALFAGVSGQSRARSWSALRVDQPAATALNGPTRPVVTILSDGQGGRVRLVDYTGGASDATADDTTPGISDLAPTGWTIRAFRARARS